jgi:release factor glutamine methyltransferase
LQRNHEALHLSAIEERFTTLRPEGISVREAEQHARFYVEDVFGIKYPLLKDNDRVLIKQEQEQLKKDLQRYQRHEPIQYIIGKVSFYGLTLNVTSDVLIPRQETEELVHRILKDHPEPYARVLDIGTGSGCIAIALQYYRPVWYVEALDVSDAALLVAKENASTNKVEITFRHADILTEEISCPIPFDIIVSNPPYIPHNEMSRVGPSTKLFEPGLALWVPDDDPLLYYRIIAEKAKSALGKGGALYLEINEYYADHVVSLTQTTGFENVELFRDLSDKPRMVKARI